MPPGKRQKTDVVLNEDDFLARHGNNGVFKVQVPNDDSKSEWKLNG